MAKNQYNTENTEDRSFDLKALDEEIPEEDAALEGVEETADEDEIDLGETADLWEE